MDRETLEPLVERGLTIREVAEALGVHRTTVAQWLREHGPRTCRQARAGSQNDHMESHCETHGSTTFVRRRDGGWRCLRCRSEAVSRRRRRVKEILVAEAGGACALCGYSRCAAALQFHHLDPRAKRFSVAARGVTRALSEARREAEKCVLLCSNCHAEVEAGVRVLQAKQVPADYTAEHIPG